MNFAQLPAGSNIFLDANILVFHLTSHPLLGAACTHLIQRIALKGFTPLIGNSKG